MINTTLTQATKIRKMPVFLDKINALGSPADGAVVHTNGEGSSFLSIPTKRNYHPRNVRLFNNNASPGTSAAEDDGSFVDFKHALISAIQQACTTQTGSSVAYSQDVPSQMMPTEQHWSALRQLRIHSGSPERTEKGIDKLMDYYAQLCWLEEKFAFETNEIPIKFTWFEAFQPKKRVDTSCIQYEKAAVVWNIGALYSQMGTIQSLWTQDGLKLSSQYFQKAAGAFVHLRDSIIPRISVKIDASADLTDSTLSAINELMLAQAVECYYMKAEFDSTSSPVTSQIAAQASDYYDISYKGSKANNSFGKYRFPKVWTTHMHVKHLIYLANAHLHCPNFTAPESVVGERHSRLLLALDFANKALEKCMSGDSISSPEIRVLANSTVDRIRHSLDQIDKANFDQFHQTVMKATVLKPLRRPPHTLVTSLNIIDGQMCDSIADRINSGEIQDIFEGVMAMMCLGSGHLTLAFKRFPPTPRRSLHEAVRRVSIGGRENEERHHSSSFQNLSRKMSSGMRTTTDNRRFTENDILVSQGALAPYVTEKIKKFLWDVKSTYDNWAPQITALADSPPENAMNEKDIKFVKTTAHMISKEDSPQCTETYAQEMVELYLQMQALHNDVPTARLKESLEHQAASISNSIAQISSQLFDNSNVRAQMNRRHSEPSEILQMRSMIRQVADTWTGDVLQTDDERVPSIKVNLKAVNAILSEVNQEGFQELFADSEATSDIHWTLGKIKTVVPCLQEEWKSRESKISRMANELCEALQISQNDGGNSWPQILESFAESVEMASDSFLGTHSKVKIAKDRLQDIRARWLVEESVPQKHDIIGDLKSMAGERAREMTASEQVLSGLEAARSSLEDTVNFINRLMQDDPKSSNIGHVLCDFANMLNEHYEAAKQSNKIVGVFMEQLNKWREWQAITNTANSHLCETKQWIDQTFNTLAPSPKMPRALLGHAKAARQETLSQPKTRPSKTVEMLMEDQIRLQNAQVENAFKIADKTMNIVNSYATPFQQAFDLEGPSKARQAMRKLSLAASEVNRTSQMISESTRKHQDDHELIKQRDKLASQIQLLHKQQNEFLKFHNEQMESMKRQQQFHVSNPTSRRPSLMDFAKEKIVTILTGNKKSNNETIVINGPVEQIPSLQRTYRASVPEARPPPFAPSAPPIAHRHSMPHARENPMPRKKSIARKAVPNSKQQSMPQNGITRTSMYDESDIVLSDVLRKASVSNPVPTHKKVQPMEREGRNPRNLSDHLPESFRRGKTPAHFIDHPHSRPETAFYAYDLEDSSNLRNGMDSVTKYFAWNRNDLKANTRGSLGGDQYIP